MAVELSLVVALVLATQRFDSVPKIVNIQLLAPMLALARCTMVAVEFYRFVILNEGKFCELS